MPELCRFLGIVLFMIYDEHKPASFHAQYGDYKITVEIETGVVEGRFPLWALKALMEWHDKYKDRLIEDWDLAEQHKPLNKIPPLE